MGNYWINLLLEKSHGKWIEQVVFNLKSEHTIKLYSCILVCIQYNVKSFIKAFYY